MAKSYGGVLGSRKYPVELLTKKDGGPTVEDLANIAAQVAEVPRGYQRLIFKGSLFFVRCTYNRIHLLCIRLSTLFILTYLPTSGDLKSGDSLFCTTTPALGHYMTSYMTYMGSKWAIIIVMTN